MPEQLDVYDVLQAGRVPEDLGDASRVATVAMGDASRSAAGAPARVPPSSSGSPGRICDWCGGPVPKESRVDAEVCGVVCRKRRWRFRRAIATGRVPSIAEPGRRDASLGPNDVRLARFAYADPPYPGKAGYYVERQEVDHRELIAELEAGYPDGWALSTSAAALRDVLPLCPLSVRVCAWRRRVRSARAKRALSAWEPLLVVGGRRLPSDQPQTVLDDLETEDVVWDALDYRGRYDAFPGALVGMKPPEFAVWLFAQLGARPGDELADLFPGSGAISRAWALYASLGDLDVARDASHLEPA